MHASLSFAAALVALAPVVQAQGTAYINNQCDFDVYVFPTSVGSFKGPIKIASNGGTYSQQYQTFPTGGMSMKLSKTQECVDITQFEYTLTPNSVFYDVSNVDCHATESCPFQAEGLHMTSGSDCPTVTCQPGDLKCHDAYNLFNDDWATKACDTTADTTLHLCSTSGSASSIGDGILSAVSSLLPAAPSSQAPQKAQAPQSDSVAAAAAPTSSVVASSSSSSSEVAPAKPTTLATSVKSASVAKPSVAAPATTAAPVPNIVYTTEIAYTTQWATKWVEERSVHEDYHHRARPRSPHAHARRHQPHSLE